MVTRKSGRKNLFIIDGYAVLYRSHFALIRNPLITSYGLHTSALFGFSNHILKLLRDENPDYIACAFDSKEKTFRHKRYPAYKANRPEMPAELQDQLPHLWELLEAMNIPVLKKPGVEADDIIGTLAQTASSEDMKVFIVSSDKDFMQLIDDQIFLYSPGKRSSAPVIYNHQGVVDKWGVPPEKIIDLFGLMGDSSDNIPGVAGVGVKTAVKLLNEYGSLESVLDNADKVANKRVHKGLKEGRENAILSKELVTILTDVELGCNIEDLIRKQFENEQLSKKYRELEFLALLRQIQTESTENKKASNTNKEDKNYHIIKTMKDLKALIKEIGSVDLIAFDLETTSLQPMEADIVGISFSVQADSGYYIPIKYPGKGKNDFGDDDLTTVLSTLKPMLENVTLPKTGQNIKYDVLILKRNGIDVKGIEFDTMIAAHVLNPTSRSYKLDTLSVEHLNYEMIPIENLIGIGRNQIIMDQVSLDKIAYYAAENADITFQLTKLFMSRLKENDLLNFFRKIEVPLIPVLVSMEKDGVFVDLRLLTEMSVEIGKKIDNLIQDIYRMAGSEFNVNSTQQLANILFDILKLPQIKKRSTAESVLQKLGKEHELPELILAYRKYNKLKNTYLDALPGLVNLESGRIHTTFNQSVAATGRLSSTNPNFQNIPIRTEEGREIRKAFCTQKNGWKILSADYSQIELRVMAHLCQDPALCEAFDNNEDVHARTASLVFDVALDDILPEMRRVAKVVNFGIMYGAGAFRMGQELGIPRSEAQLIIESYFEQYKGIKDYIDLTLDKARNDHYVETIMGRRRPVWDANSDNALRRQAAERMAINMPIQGSAAEMIKLAMITIQERLTSDQMKSKMILQIHDELLFEYPTEEEKELVVMVTNTMEKAMPLSVPVIVDYGIGDNWYEAH